MTDKIELPVNWPKAIHIHELLALARAGKSVIVPAVTTKFQKLDSGHKLTIQEFAVDFEDPAACTEIRLRQLQQAKPKGYFYLNPQFTVSSEANDSAFNFAATEASDNWFAHLDGRYQKKVRRQMFKHAKRQKDKRHVCYGFSGVLFTTGRQPSVP